MNKEIVDAIKNKQRVQFFYNKKLRIVEPQCYGLSKGTLKETLRAYQINASTPTNKLFTLSECLELKVLGDSLFYKPGPNYKKGDSAMEVIFAEL